MERFGNSSPNMMTPRAWCTLLSCRANSVLLGFGAGLQKCRLQDLFYFFSLLLTKSDGVPPLGPCSAPALSSTIRLLSGALAVWRRKNCSLVWWHHLSSRMDSLFSFAGCKGRTRPKYWHFVKVAVWLLHDSAWWCLKCGWGNKSHFSWQCSVT